MMTIEAELAEQLSAAQRSGSRVVNQDAFAAIDRSAAYRVQALVMKDLGASPGMLKLAVAADGSGAAAPIYATRVGPSGQLRVPSASVTGLEVEIGMVLGHDLPAGADAAAVVATIGRYFVGIEICGTRYADRGKASFEAGLADSMSALGYAIGDADWERGADLAGVDIELDFGGRRVFGGPARQAFGGVLNALIAYAGEQQPAYPLKAGTIVTTGSLCGLVPVSGTGKAVAWMGGHQVEVELI